MRRTVEARHGKLPDDEVPGATYLAAKLEEVEQNDPQATPLDEIKRLAHSLGEALGRLSHKCVDSDGLLPENFCIDHHGELVEPQRMVAIAADKAAEMASHTSVSVDNQGN